jgi:hypothetical protein
MKTLGVNTATLLQNAPSNGLIKREFVYFTAKNRDTGDDESLGVWNGQIPYTASVYNPKTKMAENRLYQPLPDLALPSIPADSELQVRTIRMKFSNIDPTIIAAIRQYDLRMGPVELHRGTFDPATNQLVDPAECLFFGFVNKAPIRQGKSNEKGSVDMEFVSRERLLTITSGAKFSDEFMKTRGNDGFAKYTDTDGDIRIWWGQEVTVIEHDPLRRRRFKKA